MNTRTKIIIITVIFAIPAFFLGHVIWPPDAMSPTPTSGQLPFFMILSAAESLMFGLGVSLLLFGWPLARRYAAKIGNLAYWAFIALDWSIISWWPHDNLHIHNGMNLQGLLYIEYGFHLTLMISSLIIACAFWQIFRKTNL